MSGSSPDIILNSTVLKTTTANIINVSTSTQSTLMASVSTSTSAIDLSFRHVGDGIFLQTNTSQVLAGVCVWVALFLTCQQVRTQIYLITYKLLTKS